LVCDVAQDWRGEIDMPTFLHEFQRDGLGMPLSEWRALDSYDALQIC